MKKKALFLMFVCWSLLIPLAVSGQTGSATRVLMPQFGKTEVTVSGELEFLDPWGGEGIKGANSYNSLSTIVFKPESPGQAVQITFERIDVQEYSSSWKSYPARLVVYNGKVDADDSFSYPSSTSEVNSSSQLPEGDVLSTFTGTFSNQVVYSTSPDGILSVGYLFCNASDCDGWVAKVKSVKLENMKVTGGGVSYENVDAAPVGKTGVALANFYVDAEGVMNADRITSVSFRLPENGVADAQKIRLYAGAQADCSGLKPLDATMSMQGDVYTLTLNKPLTSGRNWFTLAADVKPEAVFGASVRLELNKVTTGTFPSGVSPWATAEPVTVTVPSVVLMSKSATYNVGAESLQFYDDGGKEGKISSKFEGVVTFVPTTPGKRVQIDFSKVSLYENKYGSVTSNDDVMIVYDGKQKDESRINTVMHDGQPAVVRSMSADGALTVYLKSVTGEYYLKDGFEAVVSEYEPQQMTVKEVTVAQWTEGTVVAGDVAQPILSVNVKTENTLSLKAEAFKFTAAGTSEISHLKRATVYYTGKNNTFSSATKVGEAVLGDSGEFSVTGCSQELVEGNNYFWLAYDIAPEALTGEVVDGGCLSVTLSGKEHSVPAGQPEGNREVKNVYLSTVGTVEKTVFGTWYYESTKNPLPYYNGYEPVEGDQTVTFVPGTQGMITELDMKSFHLYYSNSSYAPKAKFEVYSGKGTKGVKLWELKSVDDKDIGPGRVLRSTSSDGALTVVFNANTTSSSYTAAGWQAEVREYRSLPMELAGVKAFQASTDVLPTSPAAKNAEIIGFKLTTKGDKDALKLEDITLNLKDSYAKIGKVYLYTSGRDSVLTLTGALAEAVPSAREVKLSLASPCVLEEGSAYFWVAYDLLDDVTTGTEFDCALASVTLSGKATTVEAGDPEGSRVARNIYLMKSGENGVVEVGNEPLVFFDEGGPDGGITRGFDGTVTFVPKHEGKAVKLTFKKWHIGGNDKMYVYYGKTVGESEDLLLKSSLTDEKVVSFADDGSLTLKFTTTSYGSAAGLDGWEIEVSEYEIQPLSLGEVKVERVNSEPVMRGATEVMLRVDVEVKGDKGKLTVGKMKFDNAGTTAATDIEGARMFATDTVATFFDYHPFGDVQIAAPYEFAGNYEVNFPGVYRFWLVYDVSTEAVVGHTLSATPVSLTVDGKETVMESNAVSTQVKAGFSGTYTVGTSADANYATLSDAVAALKDGIDGPVVFELEDGVYREVVNVPEVRGASDQNTITIRSKSGNYRDVTLVDDKYIEPNVPSDKKVESEFGVFTFAGVDYCRVENLTIRTSDAAYPAVVRVKYGSTHCTLYGCHIEAPKTTTISQDITLVEMYGRNIAGDNNDYFTVEGCLLEGGYKGITIGASWVNTPAYEKEVVVHNNRFVNQTSKSVYLQGEESYTLSGNTVVNDETTLSFTAFDLRRGFKQCVVEGNVFTLNTKRDVTAIYVEYVKADAELPGWIYNNEINMAANGTAYGIKVGSRDVTTHLNIVYNTVRLTGTNTSSAALYVNSKMSGGMVRNNLLQNEAGGYVCRVQGTNLLDGVALSNNALFTTGEAFAYVGKAIADFSGWKTAVGDTNSFNEKTEFLSSKVLEPAAAGSLCSAMPLEFVEIDLNGVERSEETPTIGAYEYADASAAPAFVEGYPMIESITHEQAEMVLKTDLSGTAYLFVRENGKPLPSVEEVLASENAVDFRRGKDASSLLKNLQPQTEYVVCTVLQNLRGVNSEVLVSKAFTTAYLPSEVSTFENVKQGEGYFEDGTARFAGFTVVDTDDAVVVGKKVAQIGEGAVITFTNSESGIPLTGFFLKADAEVKMKVYDENASAHDYTLQATDGKWIYSNLKDKGCISKIEMTAGGSAFVDNFSGEPLELMVYVPDCTANEADDVKLVASPLTGVAPYTYSWRNAMNEEISKSAICSFKAVHTVPLTVTVTDAWGHTASDEVIVTVHGKGYTATFDDFLLESESHWNGVKTDNPNGEFATLYSGSYAFSNNASSYFWSGFACSNETSVVFELIDHQFRSAAGGGYNSANYGVAYVYGGIPHSVDVTNAVDGDEVRGFYVTNTAWVKNAVLNGDGMSTNPGGFAKGDYLRLKITGEKADKSTSSQTFYLADYTSENAADHYCLDSWQWVDLRDLGAVKKVSFALEGTKTNVMGLTTPAYFCLDDFNGEREVTDADVCVIGMDGASVDLQQYFSFDDNQASISYVLTDDCDREVAEAAVEDGKLIVTPKKAEAETNVIVRGSQKGRQKFVRIPLRIEEKSGVEALYDGVVVYPVPATDYLNIATDMDDYSVEIVSVGGRAVYRSEGNSGKVRIPVSQLVKGVYIVKISNAGNCVVKRITVK